MTDGDHDTFPTDPRVGVVAPDDAAEVAAAIEAAGGTARVDAAASVVAADPDAAVAVGEPALRSLVGAGVAAPVLAVGIDGVASVPEGGAEAAVGTLVTGEFDVRRRPVLAVSTPEHDARAVMDAGLFSATPATISEFSVSVAPDAPASRVGNAGADAAERGSEPRPPTADGRTARFRADGVVVATPAGSTGYARAAGGPVLSPRSGVAAVVPIAPFALDADHWVCPPERLSITVERDDTAVELWADDRSVGTIEPGTPVTFELTGSVGIVLAPP